MNPVTCLQKLKYVGTLFCATTDKNKAPQVRCISGFHFEDDALYFVTAEGKDFAKELLSDGRIQIAGLTRFGEMIRVSGTAEQLQGFAADKMRDRIFDGHPEMQDLYPGDTRAITVVFGLTNMVIDYFNAEVSPIFRETYAIGDAEITPAGYMITDDCTECGKCLDACPQGVIEEGSPYEIEQSHCLRCGACHRVCPSAAVVTLPISSEGMVEADHLRPF